MRSSKYKEFFLKFPACGGLGYALAANLLRSKTYHVWLSGRSETGGATAISQLASLKLSGSFEFVKLDVCDDRSIAEAVDHVTKVSGRLDCLINNAAIAGDESLSLSKQLQAEFATNVIGPAVLSQACIPLLQASSSAPRIINVSSGAGSITRRFATVSSQVKSSAEKSTAIQGPRYRASKAALNMVSACQALDYAQFGIKVLTYDPGFTQSNLSSMNTAVNGARPASESATWLVDVIEGRRDHEADKFLHNSGTYEW